MEEKEHCDMERRDFLKRFGMGAVSAASIMLLDPFKSVASTVDSPISYAGADDGMSADVKMTYRVQNGSGKSVSLLGFGMMRLPREQEEVDRLVDYAIEHGVNYFDTAPMYGGGRNEAVTGATLSRYPRDKYFVATKMSNQNQALWSFEKSKEMYENSFRQLRVDYIDYYLLHSVGGGGMNALRGRFLDNGILDFLLEERKAGRIRHLGFSYHGDVSVFDYLLDNNDKYHWDFVQIQMNYLDWRHARGGKRRGGDADAEYLYNRLEKLGIQCVIMEPIRGGGLANVAEEIGQQLRNVHPDDSPARWGFRWVGSHSNVLTVLSGMNRMDHVKDNIATFSPLVTCTPSENELLAHIADEMAGFPTINCTTCAYCMPCPYGVDIPGNFAFYNSAVNKGLLPLPETTAANYAERQQTYTKAYREAIGEAARANRCQDCGECLNKCPQQIRIPNQMSRLVELTRKLRPLALLFVGVLFMSQKVADVVTKENDMTVVNTTTLASDVEGYAGTTPLKIYIKKDKIERIEALPNMETPKYFVRIRKELLTKWNGLTVKKAETQEVDVLTGATYSSDAVIENVRRGLKFYNKQKR